MNHLIIYANHREGSFNHAVLETLQKQLSTLGHSVIVRDLYKMGFDPVLTSSDLGSMHKGEIPRDIHTEQKHVEWADVIILVYPIWWTGMPAIIKGYFDRVFSYGFAYGNRGNGIEGFLGGKKGLIFNTTGQPRKLYEENGMYHALNLTSDEGIFGFCGMEMIDHVYFSSIQSVSDEVRDDYIRSVEKLIHKYFSHTPQTDDHATPAVTV